MNLACEYLDSDGACTAPAIWVITNDVEVSEIDLILSSCGPHLSDVAMRLILPGEELPQLRITYTP